MFVNPAPSLAQEFDSAQMGFGMPDITVTPTSGPPGTEVEISVKNMPAPPVGNDPRIEFFVYLPFVSAIGNNVANNCNGEKCFPVYSFEEINEGKVAPKTITFALFSKQNPDPTLQGGQMESVCDVKVNGKTIERYSTVCVDNDQPVGDYDIKFAWGIQRSDVFDVREVITFTVTDGTSPEDDEFENSDDIVFEKYKNAEITEEEFERQLADLGYSEQDIRQAKALLGKLPHQQGSFSPEQKQAIEEGIKKGEEARAEEREQEAQTAIPIEQVEDVVESETVEGERENVAEKGGGCLIATAAYGTEMSSQVQLLREVRDNVVFGTSSGATFMSGFNSFYYSFSPTVADWERQSPAFKDMVRITLTPMLSSLAILNHVGIDSESEMLGYGIGIIVLNAAMYFVLPAIIINKIRTSLQNKVE
ncbi:CFI-box-CTERM domain-containing protein [Candidatus Nitrosotenuis cloacae]|uniref:CFI-box-CTERM domain-containing protein n=1 Tax=Candidatus Nitrosotenuis cloacae TaxID=1603555 RepID=UPI00227E102E|nr:CFI-box-CTERM domain-containing protein [Candidatus Nitrosotenuis cloacae]